MGKKLTAKQRAMKKALREHGEYRKTHPMDSTEPRTSGVTLAESERVLRNLSKSKFRVTDHIKSAKPT